MKNGIKFPKVSDCTVKDCKHLKFVVNWYEKGQNRKGEFGLQRKRKFFADKDEAKSCAEDRFVDARNAQRERNEVELPTTWHGQAIEAYLELEPRGANIREAVQHYLKFLEANKGKKSGTFSEVLKQLLAAKEADFGRRHFADLKSRLGRFAETFGNRNVAEITGEQIDDWLRNLKAIPKRLKDKAKELKTQNSQPLSKLSRNNYRSRLNVAFNFAVEKKYCACNPVAETTKVIAPRSATKILTVEELKKLLAVADERIIPFIALGAFAGVRSDELQEMKWSDINMGAGSVAVNAASAKSARFRFIEMQPNLREWLLKYSGSSGRPEIAPPEITRVRWLRKAWAKVQESEKYPRPWDRNALRHSFASYYLAAKGAEKGLRELTLDMGHTNENMVYEHYRLRVSKEEAERYWEITPASVFGLQVAPPAAATIT